MDSGSKEETMQGMTLTVSDVVGDDLVFKVRSASNEVIGTITSTLLVGARGATHGRTLQCFDSNHTQVRGADLARSRSRCVRSLGRYPTG
jgi:hypothetical protein